MRVPEGSPTLPRAVAESASGVAVKFANAEYPKETGAAVAGKISYMVEYYVQKCAEASAGYECMALTEYELKNIVQDEQWMKVETPVVPFDHCNRALPPHVYYGYAEDRNSSCGMGAHYQAYGGWTSHWNVKSQTFEAPYPDAEYMNASSFFVGGDVQRRVHAARIEFAQGNGSYAEVRKGDFIHMRVRVWNEDVSKECDTQAYERDGHLWTMWAIAPAYKYTAGDVDMAPKVAAAAPTEQDDSDDEAQTP
jgi:hypothetical protein